MKYRFHHINRLKSKVVPWFQKGSWTLLDQGLFAGSNFILNILLARWLLPADYGIFTVAYTVFLLIAIVHTGLITEPMLVFGPSRYKGRLQRYIGVLLQGHAGFSILAGIGLGTTSVVFYLKGVRNIADTFLFLSLAQFFILFLWLSRRACYVELKPKWAATGGVLYALCMLSGAILLYKIEWLSPLTALGLMSAASLVAGSWILRRFRINPFRQPEAALTKETKKDHWAYGKWASATGMLEWIPGYLAFLVLPIWASLEASAALKALLNLILPISHVYAAICLLLVPIFVKARESRTFNRVISLALLLTFLGSGVYWIILGTFGIPILEWLYNGVYSDYGHLLWLVGAIPMLSGLTAILRNGLRALERPNLVFWAYLGSAIVALTLSVFLIYLYGIKGALIGFMAQMVIEIFVMTYYLKTKKSIGHIESPTARIKAEVSVA